MALQRVEDPESGVTWYCFVDSPVPDRGNAQSSPGFRHALITRLGGASQAPFASLNLGSTVGDDQAAVEENHRRLFSALGLARSGVVSPHQIHSAHVAAVDRNHGEKVIPATDALITNQVDVALLLRFADCLPVLFHDPVHRAVGLAHAGWRGVASRVIPDTVAHLNHSYGSDPRDLWAGIGPGIGKDHYPVSKAVVDAVQETLPPDTHVASQEAGQWFLDLQGAVHAQLSALGIQRIDRADICTACHTDEWYSHRAEGGKTGRFGALIALEG